MTSILYLSSNYDIILTTQLINNSVSFGVSIQWKAANAGKLSGRIIRLNVTCNYSSSTGPDTKCMLFKALGSVTCKYNIKAVDQNLIQIMFGFNHTYTFIHVV